MKHPRPQMTRNKFFILKDNWQLNDFPINVPYPPESDLSNFKHNHDGNLRYKCSFEIPEDFTAERILLHFGAVDQVAKVYINDDYIGEHEGGYLPFSFDISNFVNMGEPNVLEVKVTDELSINYPYGKQKKNHGGMWYTPVSGIWQDVWLENVPNNYIENIKLTPTMNSILIDVAGDICGFSVDITMPDNSVLHREFQQNSALIEFEAKDIINWSQENPFLYDIQITAGEDVVESYFALRIVEIISIDGINRLCLNKKPIFMHGVLDQGYFQNGIYLPKDLSEYENDILKMKELGFNTLRKHIKIEPEHFYYYCDKYGMLVVQDMVNSGTYSYLRDTVLPTIGGKRMKDVNRIDKKNKDDDFRRAFFEKHMIDTINHLYNHPCILVYTIFNEGWGQFDSDKMYNIAKKTDSTRLYDSTSGWFAQDKSDFDSKHIYFRSVHLKTKTRPLFLSECGGFSYRIMEHCFNTNKSYGYGSCKSKSMLTDRIIGMYNKMVIPAIKLGLCGCIYTQLSDVEDEINGFYTYDREVCKVHKEKIIELSENIYKEIGKIFILKSE